MTRPDRNRARLACWLTALVSWQVAADEEALPPADQSPSPDTSRWLCRLCPYPDGWYGTLDFGIGWVGEASNRFGTYRGLEDDGPFPVIGGDIHYRGATGRFFDLTATHLGLDSRQVRGRAGDRGRYRVGFDWREIPTYRGDDSRTPFRGAGSDRLTLPRGWRAAGSTADMPDLADSLTGTALGIHRKTLDLGLDFRIATRWTFDAQYRHDEKSGTRPFGAGVFLLNTTHFPAPVDYTTDRFELGLSLAGDRAHLRAAFVGSEFRNGTDSVTWDNPFTAISGTEVLRASLAPDNSFHQFNLAGAWSPGRALRLSGRMAWSRMEQDDRFGSGYSINPQFSGLPLPRAAFDGRIDATTLDLAGRLAARLGDRMDFVARFSRDERDNESSVDLWTPVITDIAPRELRSNRPYSFRRDRYGLELTHRTAGRLRLSGGWGREDFERSLQSVSETREDTFWVQTAFDPASTVHVRLRYERAERDATPYRQLLDGGPLEHPLQRKFHLAERERERGLLELDFVPTDRLAVSLSAWVTDDEYEATVIGLKESSERNLTVDLNYTVGESVFLHGFATHENIESTMASAVFDGAAPWLGTTDDQFLTFGFGATHQLSNRLRAGAEFVHSDARGRIAVDPGAGASRFPELETRLQTIRLHVDYRFSDRWSAGLSVDHERYDSDDWSVDGDDPVGGPLGADGIPAVLTFGSDSPDYDVFVIRLLASCRF